MVDIRDVVDAARRLEGVAVRTPLIENAELNERAGARVLLKPECLQRTGSFKIRGAFNLMSRLSPEDAERGVVAWSSGNHAQGVAAAGRMLGIHAAIVMPADAPRAKLENTRALGGEVITYDRYTGDREAIAREIASERGAVLVPSYDHADIIAGQGTVGLEIAEQSIEIGIEPDRVLICCGGGGLTAGSAIALRDRFPDVSIHTVEPGGFDDTARSLAAGRRLENDASVQSICDALLAHTPGAMTFPINQKLTGPGVVVSEEDVRDAMRFAFLHLKLVLEPGGAVALAAVLADKINEDKEVVVAVISGGNVDEALFAEIQAEPN